IVQLDVSTTGLRLRTGRACPVTTPPSTSAGTFAAVVGGGVAFSSARGCACAIAGATWRGAAAALAPAEGRGSDSAATRSAARSSARPPVGIVPGVTTRCCRSSRAGSIDRSANAFVAPVSARVAFATLPPGREGGGARIARAPPKYQPSPSARRTVAAQTAGNRNCHNGRGWGGGGEGGGRGGGGG